MRADICRAVADERHPGCCFRHATIVKARAS
jgi:hypothetical protein